MKTTLDWMSRTNDIRQYLNILRRNADDVCSMEVNALINSETEADQKIHEKDSAGRKFWREPCGDGN